MLNFDPVRRRMSVIVKTKSGANTRFNKEYKSDWLFLGLCSAFHLRKYDYIKVVHDLSGHAFVAHLV